MTRRPDPRSRPPLLVRWILSALLRNDDREFYFGDLEESGRRSWLREVASVAAMRMVRRPGLARPALIGSLGRDGRSASTMGHLLTDLRLGCRQLLRTPGATLTALIALSIGIGMSGMMFSIIRGGLLPTLPVPNGNRMVRVQHQDHSPTPPELFGYWVERQQSFEGLGVTSSRAVSLIIDGAGGEPVSGAAIDKGTLPLLSVEPIIGRTFTEADAVPGAPRVVLVGYDVWQSRMKADAGVLGTTIRMDGAPATVIGVMPEGFAFPFREQLWTTLSLDGLETESRSETLQVFGLLREGVSNRAAASELTALSLERPRAASDPDPIPVNVKDYTNIVTPGEMTYILAGLMAGVALLVLLVACANVTNVLLARAAVRAREVAVRAALGASRSRIAKQFLAETLLLAAAGAAGGAMLAAIGLDMVRGAADAPGMPFWFDLRLDVPAVGFVVVSALTAALAAGVLPAIHAAGSDGHDLLKDATRGTSSRKLGTLMGRLIGAELTVSFVLLVASGLFIQSAVNLERYDFGFGPDEVYTSGTRLPEITYESVEARLAFIEEYEERLAAIPGASGAALATVLPGIGHQRVAVAIDGTHDPTNSDLPTAGTGAVTPGYFETYRAPPLSGRTFRAGDRAGELPVAIVNTSFERAHFPGGAVGRRLAIPSEPDQVEWRTVVGVVPDHLAPGIDDEHPLEVVYVPLAQAPSITFYTAVRARGPVSAMAGPIRELAADLDPDVALYFMRPLDEAITAANASFIWMSALFLVAGTLALFLAAVGLYGVMAFWVSQRTREIGVRMAVGGAGNRIVGLVLGQGLAKIALGLVAGVLLSVPVAWLLRGALLDVSPFDPVVFGSVFAVLLLAGTLGCAIPAIRATRVDPQSVLAAE